VRIQKKGDESGRQVARKNYEECYGSLSYERQEASKHSKEEVLVTSEVILQENIQTL